MAPIRISNASGATRIAGSFNFKSEYAPYFPRVQICEVNRGRLTSPGELDQLGIVAPPEEFAPVSPARSFKRLGNDSWPIYAKALDGAPRNRAGTGPDRSRADYWWCFLAIAWDHGIDETADRLMQESAKARAMGKSYALMTARNAVRAVDRQRPEPPRQHRASEHGRR